MDFSNFRVITFDCYGTLIDWERGILGALRPILSAHGANLAEREILRLYGEIEAEEESGRYRDYKEVLRSVVRAFGRRLRFEPSESEAQSLPDSLSTWQPFPDTVPALRRLQARFHLGIISNIDDDLFSRTSRLLEVDFDHVITAAQAQAIAGLKQQIPGLFPPHVITYADAGQVLGEATLITGQTQMPRPPDGMQAVLGRVLRWFLAE